MVPLLKCQTIKLTQCSRMDLGQYFLLRWLIKLIFLITKKNDKPNYAYPTKEMYKHIFKANLIS